MKKVSRALLSVSKKEGLIEFARGLAALGVELVSTGGTAGALKSQGLATREVSEITGFPQILEGRVKTLHPMIFGGILAAREKESHGEDLARHGIPLIDLVVVNLYPFMETVSRPGVALADAIEQIDIGGVALIRAAAKNFANVAVVTDPGDYERVLAALQQHDREVPEGMRMELARKGFAHTNAYDAAIARYLEGRIPAAEAPAVPSDLHLHYRLGQALRYGENPHQRAWFYREEPLTPVSLANAVIHQGKEISYNNLLDLDAALEALGDFIEPTAVVLKHNTPCGLASAPMLAQAYEDALACDPVSAFGCIIGLNRPVDLETAQKIHETTFVECVLAPSYAPGVLELFASKKTRRILGLPGIEDVRRERVFSRRLLRGGLLVQDMDAITEEDFAGLQVVTKRSPTDAEQPALRFAWRAVKSVKSNAIVLVQGTRTVGIGAGQMSRVDSVRIAVQKAGDRAKGSVLGSDAFFPMPDGVEEAARAGVTAVIQPGGSKKDPDVIAAADRLGIAMLLTGRRHFRH